MEVYFDNSATTRCHKRVQDIVQRTMDIDYGNPSSLHGKGVAAERYVREARRKIASLLKVSEKEIIFTSGGTESDNLALIGTAMANRRAGMHLITTQMEHPAVRKSMEYLEEQGFTVTYLPADPLGRIRLPDLEEALRPDTVLVSVMHVNNEIGSVLPVEAAAKLVKERCQGAVFHTDAIQSFGKYRLYPKRAGIGLVSVSGHKIGGPKGVGFLFVDDKVKIRPTLFGGGQQRDLRSGTENVPGIAGLGEAAGICYEEFEKKRDGLYRLKEALIAGLSRIDGVNINGLTQDIRDTAPHIVSVSVRGVRSEVLLHALEERGIYVSAGSACSSNKPSPSKTLQAIGLERELLLSTVRFSFCDENTEEEVSCAVNCMEELIPALRRFTRR